LQIILIADRKELRIDMQESLRKKSDQLQILGNIFSLLDQFDLDDMAVTTDGSQLGKVVSLLSEVKAIFAELPKSVEPLDKHDKAQSKAKVSGHVRQSSPPKAQDTKAIISQKKALVQPAIMASTTNKPVASKPNASESFASKPNVSSRDSSVTSKKTQGQVASSKITFTERDDIVTDYLKQVCEDLELFPNRGSINEFFKVYFGVEFNLNKKSRAQVTKRLCSLLLQKKLKRSQIADILLKATKSKYGAFLKEDDAVFLKGWKQ
jgi:hypothetical protein